MAHTTKDGWKAFALLLIIPAAFYFAYASDKHEKAELIKWAAAENITNASITEPPFFYSSPFHYHKGSSPKIVNGTQNGSPVSYWAQYDSNGWHVAEHHPDDTFGPVSDYPSDLPGNP